ncbi:MAG: hypothetical protein J6Q22_03240 [Prevotella sp.]|nr:hypothetical protein [Prevotella sp.]
MNSTELSRVVNRYLFVPISDDSAEQLHSVAISLAATLTVAEATSYVEAIFDNRAQTKFVLLFNLKYEDSFDEKIYLPTIVYVVLEVYVLWQALFAVELSENLKRIISLLVRNYSVLKKGNWDDLLCQEWIKDLYVYYEAHGYKTVETVRYTDLLNAVVPKLQWSRTGLDIGLKDVYDQLRSLCVAGVKDQVSEYLGSIAFQNVRSPFAKVYLLVDKMVYEWNWKYICKSPVRKIAEALGSEAKKRKKLSKIATEISKEITENQVLYPNMPSSILLRRISNGKPCNVDDCFFSALEFGVYLYYELLLESINN